MDLVNIIKRLREERELLDRAIEALEELRSEQTAALEIGEPEKPPPTPGPSRRPTRR